MSVMSLFLLLVHLSLTFAQQVVSFGSGTTIGDDASALTQVVLQGRVGVLLDEFPTTEHNSLIQLLQGKDPSWWRARAELQIDLTSYRLTYRAYYYGGNKKFQLVLPDHFQWSFQWNSDAGSVEFRQGHKLFSRNYTMTTYILSTHGSIKTSERMLADIGGQWHELFTLPIDPTLLLQRTGFACIDEAQYPPNTAFAEKVEIMYDDTCKVEHLNTLIGDLGCNGCHCTEPLPTQSCVDTLRDKVGSIDVDMIFTRIAFDATLANQLRTPPPTVTGADLTPSQADLDGTRVLYRYFPPGSCERAPDEVCIGNFGWRRLLYFDAVDKNVGSLDVDMQTTAFVTDGISHNPPTQEVANGLYEYSTCHRHYHFRHFGAFSYQNNQVSNTSKRGFCVASVNRWANAEWSPTYSPYSTCETQGITSGWSDVYQSGTACQWIDITDIPGNSGTLSSKTNYDGLLCEGKLVTNPDGSQIYELTPFTTLSGNPVSKQKCNPIPNYDSNNQASATVVIPGPGESYVTESCVQAGQHFGPLRNCEFDKVNPLIRTCNAGQQKTLTCSFGGSKAYQVLRVCEVSKGLNVGTACRHQDALANVVIAKTGTTFNFQCPAAKPGDSIEIGGSFSLYTAALQGDSSNPVSCS